MWRNIRKLDALTFYGGFAVQVYFLKALLTDRAFPTLMLYIYVYIYCDWNLANYHEFRDLACSHHSPSNADYVQERLVKPLLVLYIEVFAASSSCLPLLEIACHEW